MKKELAVAALENGIVIDHIPASQLFRCVELLDLKNLAGSITIGNNLYSSKIGRKGIIKIADTELGPEVLSRIALIAPSAVVNVIRDYEVVEKRPVSLPDQITGLVECPNPKCVTRHEPIPSRFTVVKRDPVVLKCRYCEQEFSC